MTEHLTWYDAARRAINRIHEPVVVDGVEYLSAPIAARRAGCSASWLRRRCRAAPGVFAVLEGEGGIRFIRIPRHDGDARAPLYVDMRTI